MWTWYTRTVLIDLAFTPSTARPGLSEDVAIVIDVLRMTTNAAVLFSKGIEELYVVPEVDEARALAETSGALLYGERGGLALPGFHGGNSPLEHPASLAGRSALLCTTNGSLAVHAVSGAREVLLGSIVNARAVAEHALSLDAGTITLVCAGTNGLPSLDDVVGAACIARELTALEPEAGLTDSAKMGLMLLRNGEELAATLGRAAHAAVLRQIGAERDIEFAARLNSIAIVPERTALGPATFRAAPRASRRPAQAT